MYFDFGRLQKDPYFDFREADEDREKDEAKKKQQAKQSKWRPPFKTRTGSSF